MKEINPTFEEAIAELAKAVLPLVKDFDKIIKLNN